MKISVNSIILTVFIMVFSIISFGQQKIYFVSGTPFFYQVRYFFKKPVIFAYDKEKKELDTLRVLSVADSCNLAYLNLYEEYDLLVMYEDGRYPKRDNYLTIVNLKKPNELKVRKIDFGVNSTRQANLIVNNKQDYYYCLHIGGIGYFGYNSNLEQKEILPDELKNSYIKGSQGTAVNNIDWMPLKKKNNHYYIDTKTYNSDYDIKFCELPPDTLFKSWGTYRYYNTISVNNNKVLAIITNNPVPDEKVIGKIGYQIKNKVTGEWHFKIFKGGRTLVVGFGSWLAANVADYNRGTYFLEMGKPIEYDFKRVTPGLENRRPLFASAEEEEKFYGESESFDQRNGWFGDYYPGILFLYNVETKKYIEWNTLENEKPQGDSEILLVENEIVYYRINDKIYKAPIINGEKLGTPELLVQDPRVPDIHWAFISEN
ncbi:MAG: hypothetical protein SNJ71_06190 [Bacteroidales bacterium]